MRETLILSPRVSSLCSSQRHTTYMIDQIIAISEALQLTPPTERIFHPLLEIFTPLRVASWKMWILELLTV